LGYGRGELLGRSWYRLLHPEDLGHVARPHLRLGSLGLPLGLSVATLQRPGYLMCPLGSPPVCVPPPGWSLEAEAWCLRQQLAAEAPPGPPEPFSSGLDFPSANIGAGGDLEVGTGPGLGLGVEPGVELGVGAGLGDDVGASVGINIGLGVNIGCGLGT
ncbi:NPAS4 protein, partial [Zapornia atra]|nr:NPAS4 protein [Zapornia atra]